MAFCPHLESQLVRIRKAGRVWLPILHICNVSSHIHNITNCVAFIGSDCAMPGVDPADLVCTSTLAGEHLYLNSAVDQKYVNGIKPISNPINTRDITRETLESKVIRLGWIGVAARELNAESILHWVSFFGTHPR